MTRHTIRAIVAVRAAMRDAANQYWKNNIDPDGGENTFTVGLSPTGIAPATWYWCCTALDFEQMKKLVQVADNNPTNVRILIWARRLQDKPRLLAAAEARNYITIVNRARTPQEALTHFGMQVVGANT